MKCIMTMVFALSMSWAATAGGDSLVGSAARAWHVSDWINSAPLTLEQLRGKVVLVRWWTAPHCPYCRATAPALNEFHREYAAAGLQVLGFYHHKSQEPLDVAKVQQHAQDLGFEFPEAIDRDWKSLKQWWLKGDEKKWTSVSFLVDRKGKIRHIHPGGEYVKGDVDYRTMKRKIEELLREK